MLCIIGNNVDDAANYLFSSTVPFSSSSKSTTAQYPASITTAFPTITTATTTTTTTAATGGYDHKVPLFSTLPYDNKVSSYRDDSWIMPSHAPFTPSLLSLPGSMADSLSRDESSGSRKRSFNLPFIKPGSGSNSPRSDIGPITDNTATGKVPYWDTKVSVY